MFVSVMSVLALSTLATTAATNNREVSKTVATNAVETGLALGAQTVALGDRDLCTAPFTKPETWSLKTNTTSRWWVDKTRLADGFVKVMAEGFAGQNTYETSSLTYRWNTTQGRWRLSERKGVEQQPYPEAGAVCNPATFNNADSSAQFSGTDWNNTGSGGKTFTLYGGGTYSAANGGGLVLNGTNQFGATSVPVVSTPNNSPITLEAVARRTGVAGPVLGTSGSFTQIGFNGLTLSGGRWGSGGNILLQGGSISLNTWYHMVLVYDGTTGYLYKNGVLAASGSIGSNGAPNGVSTVGTNRYPGSVNDDYLGGQIGFVRVYNKALTAKEVNDNFKGVKTKYNLP